MTIQVNYPSGKTFTVHGIWRGPQRVLADPNILGIDADCVLVEQGDGSYLALDPRGPTSTRPQGEPYIEGGSDATNRTQ